MRGTPRGACDLLVWDLLEQGTCSLSISSGLEQTRGLPRLVVTLCQDVQVLSPVGAGSCVWAALKLHELLWWWVARSLC